MMDFTYADEPVLRNDYLIRDVLTGRIFSDRLNIITLQIPCIQAKSLAECRESYEKCLFLLKAMRDSMLTFQDICKDIENETASEEVKAMLRRVAEAANVEQLSSKDRAAYEYALKRYRDYYGGIMTAEEKGVKKGKTEVAKAMKANDLSPDIIAACTGLSESEIASL